MPRSSTASADPAARGVDALQLRRRRAPTASRPVLRDAGHPGHLAPGLEGGHRARPSPDRARPLRPGPLAAVPTDVDRSEAGLAEEHPDKLEELKALWLEEAKKYNVLPLNDLGIFEFRALEYEVAVPASSQYTYYPAPQVQASAANTINVSYKILAEVEFTPNPKA